MVPTRSALVRLTPGQVSCQVATSNRAPRAARVQYVRVVIVVGGNQRWYNSSRGTFGGVRNIKNIKGGMATYGAQTDIPERL